MTSSGRRFRNHIQIDSSNGHSLFYTQFSHKSVQAVQLFV